MISAKVRRALLVKTREALDELWNRAWLKGRPWGRKLGHMQNPYLNSNIAIAIGNELVSVSQNIDGSLSVHEFCRASHTLLGKQVRAILQENGLKIKEG